jgi:hypothetical protein
MSPFRCMLTLNHLDPGVKHENGHWRCKACGLPFVFWKNGHGESLATNWIRSKLLRLALGRSTFDYMLRSIKADKRTPGAKLVDIVVRQDAVENRIEADWVKTIARLTQHIERPTLGESDGR